MKDHVSRGLQSAAPPREERQDQGRKIFRRLGLDSRPQNVTVQPSQTPLKHNPHTRARRPLSLKHREHQEG